MPWSSWRVNAPRPVGRLGRRSGLPRAVSGEAESVHASRGPGGRPSSESEIAFASRGLGGGGSTASEASEGPLRGAGPWAERDLGFPYLKKLRASEFKKDLARVPNYVLRVLRVF